MKQTTSALDRREPEPQNTYAAHQSHGAGPCAAASDARAATSRLTNHTTFTLGIPVHAHKNELDAL